MRKLLMPGLLALLWLPAFAQESTETTPAADPVPPETTAPAAPGIPTIPVEPLREEPVIAAQAEAAIDAPKLDDIIVTATKREKSVREVPVSINAVSGDVLEKMGARDIQDYIATVPGITLQEGPAGEAGGRKFTIRGVGPSEVNTVSGNQTVGQFIGDVPMTDPYSNLVTPDLDPFDLQAVEILKGPQGTYFGASALNGAIRYVPAKPELGTWAARGFAEGLRITQGGQDATYALAVNAPIGDTIAVRAGGVLQSTPGYIDNLQRDEKDADSRDKWSARGAVRWQPSDRLEMTLMYLKQASHRDDVLDVDTDGSELSNNQHPGPSFLETGFDLASLDTRYELETLGTLVLQNSLQHKNVLGNVDTTLITGPQGITNFRTHVSTDVEGTTHELRLVSPAGGDWDWIVGAFFLDYGAEAQNDAYLPGTALPLPLPLPLPIEALGPRGISYGSTYVAPQATETSLYGELTRRLGTDWELTAGARLYRTRIHGVATFGGLLGGAVPDAQIDLRDQGVSPKLSLAWAPSEGFMMYVTSARGFQFGGVNTNTSGAPADNPLTGPVVPISFESSNLWSHEIGVRTDWLDRTLRADLVAFYLDWNDAQFVEYNDNPTVDTTYVSNVGKVESQGAEASLNWLTPLDGLSLAVAAGYTRAVTAVEYTARSRDVVPSGTEMPNTPRWQTATTLAYTGYLGAWVAGGSLVHTYASRAWNTITHDYAIFDYQALNLGLNVSRPDIPGGPLLSFGVTNLTDTRGLVGRSNVMGIGTAPSSIFIRPRAFTLRLSFEIR